MSTPQTLSMQLPPHQHLDPHSRYLPPPTRPSSNLSNGYHHNIPTRPSSNLSNRHIHGSESGVTTSGFGHAQAQSRGAPDYTYSNHSHLHQQPPPPPPPQPQPPSQSHHSRPLDELSRANSASSQYNSRYLPPSLPQASHSTHPHLPVEPMPADQHDGAADAYGARKRRQRAPVDWVAFYGGRPPAEIIEIHDDNSPAPPTTIHRLPPPATTGEGASHHVHKKQRTDKETRDAPAYSTTNTPYSYTNGTSTESLQTTAATSLTSNSSSSRMETAQTGQKRKRTGGRPSDADRNKVERAGSLGPRGYLAAYGEYIPPPKQHRKQKEVHVPVVHERIKPTEKIDDDDGHYVVHEDSQLGQHYSVVKLLGQGTFGKVVQAVDQRSQKEVAVKIIRAVPKYRDASRIELRVLQTLRAADERNRNRCIQLRDCFDWRGHICIVTPLLGLSVFDFLKGGNFVPFPSSHIQAFARQLLGSIAFLHDLNLIHTDLKPENILLLNHNYQTFTYNRNIPSSSTLTSRQAKFRKVLLSPQINLIDFGSATFDDEYHSSVVSTRHYRAPEIILGIGWSHPIDLWSLGCILVECWTGDALFQTHDCGEHLSMMQAVIGREIDKHLVQEVRRLSRRNDKTSALRFFKNNKLVYPPPDAPRQSRRFVRAMKRLEEIIPPVTEFNKQFLDFLRRIFVYDPKKRITAREALKHPWFNELVEDDGTEATRIREAKEKGADAVQRNASTAASAASAAAGGAESERQGYHAKRR